MSKSKVYNKGVESGIKVAEEIIKKEVAAIDYLNSKVNLIGNEQDRMKAAVNKLIDDADNRAIRDIYGICNSLMPNEIKDHEQKMLLDIIASLFTEETNDNQKQYYNNLRHHLNIQGYQPDNNYDFSNIDSLESVDSSKVIAKAVRIFLFLSENNMNGIDLHEDDLFSYFNINSRSFYEIDAAIELIYSLFKEDGLIEFYGDFEIIEEDNQELDANMQNNCYNETNSNYEDDEDYLLQFQKETEPAPDKLTEITLSSIMQIKSGEVKDFSYNIVHINTYINCKGTLVFRNCIVYYNDSEGPSEISLEEKSNVVFYNCKIVMGKYSKNNHLIKGTSESILIKDSTFENCNRFCCIDVSEKFLIDNCFIYNCKDNFVQVWSGYKNENKIFMNNCIVADDFSYDDHTYFGEKFDLKKGRVSNSTIIRSNNSNDDSIYFENLTEANNCTFIGVTKCLNNVTNVLNCQFKDCNEVISLNYYDFGDLKCKIDNCCFEQCNLTIDNRTNTNTRVSYCQFLECSAPSIISYSDSDTCKQSIIIEFCEFINIFLYPGIVKRRKKMAHLFLVPSSFITVNKQNNKESKLNIISKCVFNGVELDDEWLIEPVDLAGGGPLSSNRNRSKDKMLRIDDCSFMNCSVKNELIKKTVQYNMLLMKDLDFEAVSIYDCKGLNDVNKGGCKASNYVIKKTNTSGEPIGSIPANKYDVSELASPMANKISIGAYRLIDKFKTV